MSRKPEIGNVQLYPSRPLKRSDKNGYVLKFYCPIRCVRVRKNCGTRDRREARRIQRECQERLLNGEYLASDGAITAAQAVLVPRPVLGHHDDQEGPWWEDCYERYRQHRATRVRAGSLADSLSRIQIAERIFQACFQYRDQSHGLLIRECCTLGMLEYLQDRLLAGDESNFDCRSPNTVNSMMGAVMAFVRYCHDHDLIDRVPRLQKLDVDEVMKGRPVTSTECERMLDATPAVVGTGIAGSWMFTIRVLWESAFRVSDVMDFSWDDDRHIHPVWPNREGQHPTLVIPSTQKNGEHQVVPMLPGLRDLLLEVPEKERTGWVVNPRPMEYQLPSQGDWFQPAEQDLRRLITQYNNCAIAAACGVTETTIRHWIEAFGIERNGPRRLRVTIPNRDVEALRYRSARHDTHSAGRSVERLTKDRVGRVIAMIGKEAEVIVRQADVRKGNRVKYASAHDLRRGCALRLIDAGVSAETLMVVMRHANFATTQKFYGAMRSAQAAAAEVQQKMSAAQNPSLVGGLVGGINASAHLSASEVQKLKQILNSL